jgi:hypothetical protein
MMINEAETLHFNKEEDKGRSAKFSARPCAKLRTSPFIFSLDLLEC